MKSDNFFEEIDQEVFVANAEKINVYVRYAATKMGTTNPNGYATFKVDVAKSVTATTETDYGFYKWAAFPTDYFRTNEQNTSIIYVSEEDYAAKIEPHELDPSVVEFSSPKSEITDVTIHKGRSDIAIVPVCAERPEISRTLPPSGDSNVVRNMNVRIQFSKPMSLESFKDESGVSRVKFFQGNAIFTDQSQEDEEITDFFDAPEISSVGTIVTFKLKGGNQYKPNGQITVRISNEIQDQYGYRPSSASQIQFRTGTHSDSYPPVIKALTAGIKDDYQSYSCAQEGFAGGTQIGDYTVFFDHRAKDKLNIYIYAADKTSATSQEVESDVALVMLKAYQVFVGQDGNILPSSSTEVVASGDMSYLVGTSDVSAISPSSNGMIFSYDISDSKKFKDGLIRIDLAGVDYAANSGFGPGEKAYGQLYIVKDSTAPDAAKIAGGVESKSVNVPYGWYNAASIGKMEFVANQSVVDFGPEQFRSKKLYWTFKLGSAAGWIPRASDSGWKDVKEGYTLSGSAENCEDGDIVMSVAFKDDMDNVSAPAKINSAKYDNAQPQFQGEMIWLTQSGNAVNSTDASSMVSGNAVIGTKFLQIPFAENLSGARRLGIISAGPDSGGAEKFAVVEGSTKIFYGQSFAQKEEVKYKVVKDSNGDYVEFEKNFASGKFFIQGLDITPPSAQDINGKYTVRAFICDAALNKNANSPKATVNIDASVPQTSAVEIVECVEDSERKFWLSKSAYENFVPSKATVSFTVDEETGLSQINLGGDVEPTANTKVYVYAGGWKEVASANYSISYSAEEGCNAIVFKEGDYVPYKIQGGSVSIRLSNIKVAEKAAGAKVKVCAKDLTPDAASGPEDESVAYFIDKTAPAKPVIKLFDQASDRSEFPQWKWEDEKSKFTDSEKIDIEVALAGGEESGVKTLEFAGVSLESATVTVSGATGSASGAIVTFGSELKDAQTIEIKGAVLTSANRNKEAAVSVSSVDLVEWKSESAEEKIVHDDKKPAFDGEPKWKAESASGIDGITDNPNQASAVSKQRLEIKFAEAGSGLKAIKIEAEKSGAATTVQTSGVSVFANGSALSASDFAASGNSIIFASPLKSCKIEIAGLSLGSTAEDALYTAKVSLYDAAENSDQSASGNSARICVDNTAPVISKIVLPNIKRAQYYGMTGWHYFFGRDDVVEKHGKVDVRLFVTEKTSGLKTLDFSQSDIKPTSASKVKFKGSEISDFRISGGVVTFEKAFEIYDENEFLIEISDCQIEKIKKSASQSEKNSILVKASDFAENVSAEKTQVTYEKEGVASETYSEILANALGAGTPLIAELKDRGTGDSDCDLILAAEGFANYKVVEAKISIPAKSESGDATQKITLSGAQFVESGQNPVNSKSNVTEISIESGGNSTALTKGADYTISGGTIEFEKAFSSQVTLVLKNIELSGADGEKTVAATSYAPTEISSSQASKEIILDTSAPALNGSGPYFAGPSQKVWPRNSDQNAYGITTEKFGDAAAAENGDGVPVRYFYSGESGDLTLKVSITDSLSECGIIVSSQKSEDQAKAQNIVSATTTISDATKPESSNTFVAKTFAKQTSPATPYTYVALDAAGNVSKAHSFYVIKDDSLPSESLVSRMVLTTPQFASVHRNPESAGEKTYVIKKILSGEKYKIKVRLEKIESAGGEALVDGSALQTAAAYSEIFSSKSQSGLAAWAISLGSESPAKWNDYDAESSQNIEFEIDMKNASDAKKITLHLKDNCANEKSVQIQETGGTLVKWIEDSAPPIVQAFYAASKLEGAYASGTGTQFGRTYVKNGTTFFNQNAYLGVKYSENGCKFETAAQSDGTPIAAGFSVKARLYYTNDALQNDDASAQTIITATDNVSQWFYFADKDESERTFYKNYSGHLGEGQSSKIYLLLSDTVGNSSVTQVYNGASASGAKLFVYNNEPPAVPKIQSVSVDGSELPEKNIFPALSALEGQTQVYFKGASGDVSFSSEGDGDGSGLKGIFESGDADFSGTNYAEGGSKMSVSSAAQVSLVAVDKVGNVSAAFEITVVPDAASPQKPKISSITGSAIASAENISPALSALEGQAQVYFKGAGGDVSFASEGDGDGSGLKGIFASDDTDFSGTNYAESGNKMSVSSAAQVSLVAVDNVGNVSAAFEITITPDAAAPAAPAVKHLQAGGSEISSGLYSSASDWKNTSGSAVYFNSNTHSDVKVLFTEVSDEGSGFKAIFLKEGGGNFTAISGNLSGEIISQKTLTAVARDNVGNESAEFEITVVPDSAGPVLAFASDKFYQDQAGSQILSSQYLHYDEGNSTYYYNGNEGRGAFPCFTATDSCGIEKVYLKGTPQTDLQKNGDSYYLASQKSGALQFFAVDNVGNVSAALEFTLTADNSPPQGLSVQSIVGGSGSPLATFPALADAESGDTVYFKGASGQIRFSDSISDEGSGFKAIFLKEGGGNFAEISGNLSGTFTSKASLAFYCEDNVGNKSAEFEITVVPDNEGPVISEPIEVKTFKGAQENTSQYLHQADQKYYFNAAKSGGVNNVSSIKITLAASDAGSGIDTYACDAGAYSGGAFEISQLNYDSQWTAEITVTDKVGNQTKKQITFAPDSIVQTPAVKHLQAGGSEISSGLYSSASDWKTASGSAVYFNSNTHSDVKVLFTEVSDEGSGIEGIYSGGTKLQGNLSDAITLQKTLTAVARDNVGNESAEFEITVVPDGAGPASGTAELVEADGVYKSGSTIYFGDVTSISFSVENFLDAESGVNPNGYKYSVDGAFSSQTALTGGTLTVSDLPSEGAALKIYASDNVGNFTAEDAAISFALQKDSEAPQAALDFDAANWHSLSDFSGEKMHLFEEQAISAAITESTGKTFYKIFYAESEPNAASEIDSEVSGSPLALSLQAEGEISLSKNFYLGLKDAVGNVSYTIINREEKPIAPYAAPSDLTYGFAAGDADANENATLTISGYPINSGLKQIVIKGTTSQEPLAVAVCGTNAHSAVLNGGNLEITIFESGAYLASGQVEISLPPDFALDSDPSVFVVDAKGQSVQVSAGPGGLALFALRARAAASGAARFVASGAKAAAKGVSSALKSAASAVSRVFIREPKPDAVQTQTLSESQGADAASLLQGASSAKNAPLSQKAALQDSDFASSESALEGNAAKGDGAVSASAVAKGDGAVSEKSAIRFRAENAESDAQKNSLALALEGNAAGDGAVSANAAAAESGAVLDERGDFSENAALLALAGLAAVSCAAFCVTQVFKKKKKSRS